MKPRNLAEWAILALFTFICLVAMFGCGGDDTESTWSECDGPNLVYHGYSGSIAVSPNDPKCV